MFNRYRLLTLSPYDGGVKRMKSNDAADEVGIPGAPSVFAMMGLTAAPAALAERLYVAQLKATDRLGGLRLTMGIVSIVFVNAIDWGFASSWLLAAWSLAAAASVVLPVSSDLHRRKHGYRGLGRSHIWLD